MDNQNINSAFNKLNMKLDSFVDGLYDILHKAGMVALCDAKETGDYKDQTGRLRNASGFEITDDNGKVIETQTVGETNPVHIAGVNPLEGAVETRKYLKSLPPARGISITLGNGMPYTTFVQSKGYTVLDTAQLCLVTGLEKTLKNK